MSASAESVRPLCSDSEWQARVDLAALYRLFVRYGWTDLIYTHISARVPDEPDRYLINSYGLFFDEITASSLLKVDFDGNVLDERGLEYNEAGHLIHSAVLKARPDINYRPAHPFARGHRSLGDEVWPAGVVATLQHHSRQRRLPRVLTGHLG